MKLYDVIRKEEIGQESEPVTQQVEQVRPARRPLITTHRHVSWKKIGVIALVLLFIALLYVVGMKMARAKVVVTERAIPFSLDGAEFELVHEGASSAGRLSFQTMVVSAEVSRQVYGSEVAQSTSYAKGNVVFFNEYSTKAQTIKAKTTITSKEGKKYQTTVSVTVPGYTLKNKVKTPGTSVAVPVVATGVGPSYNTQGTSFSVSGWGKTLYAQSSGAISGGEDGMRHSVAKKDEADVISALQNQLVERLKRETRAQMPEDFITFPDLQITTIDSSSLVLHGESIKFPASIKGSMTTYLIPRTLLETTIANHVLHDRTYARVTIPALASLAVIPTTALDSKPQDVPETIKVRVSGDGTIIAKASLDAIKESLVGTSKGDFSKVLDGVPEVDSAEYHFYPFWAPLFPSADNRIKVEIK